MLGDNTTKAAVVNNETPIVRSQPHEGQQHHHQHPHGHAQGHEGGAPVAAPALGGQHQHQQQGHAEHSTGTHSHSTGAHGQGAGSGVAAGAGTGPIPGNAQIDPEVPKSLKDAPIMGVEAAKDVPFKDQVAGHARYFAGLATRNEKEVQQGAARLRGEEATLSEDIKPDNMAASSIGSAAKPSGSSS